MEPHRRVRGALPRVERDLETFRCARTASPGAKRSSRRRKSSRSESASGRYKGDHSGAGRCGEHGTRIEGEKGPSGASQASAGRSGSRPAFQAQVCVLDDRPRSRAGARQARRESLRGAPCRLELENSQERAVILVFASERTRRFRAGTEGSLLRTLRTSARSLRTADTLAATSRRRSSRSKKEA